MTSINTRNVHAELIIRLFIDVIFALKCDLHACSGMKYVYKEYYLFIISTWCERIYRKRFEN